MKIRWPFTRKQSETLKLLETVSNLAGELAAQSQANRAFAEKLLALAAEKDAQIKLVLESKFQNYVQMMPARPAEPREPESIEHLSDVSEMSEVSAEEQVEKSTKRERDADEALEAALRGEFEELSKEHAEAHK